MNKNVLGIDLGTSSVKVLQRCQDGTTRSVSERYEEISCRGWWDAVCRSLEALDLTETVAIGLSSQVGTYIINNCDVISWNSGIGAQEVRQLKETYPAELFVKEISMDHPNIASYPIPRLRYITEKYEQISSVCQPKDYLCECLTGNRVTDPYSWRGLANLETGVYSRFFLNELGISPEILPEMIGYHMCAGTTKKTGNLPAGIPVYVGLNDFYASLAGMGMEKVGHMFDISGTSEHLGIIEDQVICGTSLVSGPYLKENVRYGVTASSGAANRLGLRLWESGNFDLERVSKEKPPIFLPYLHGERAPIWDADARGVFFGIEEDCTQESLAYAAFEGVVFSLYHIYETMGNPLAEALVVVGGAAANDSVNRLKAELFEIPVKIPQQKDTSALGAALVAAVGTGWYGDLESAVADCVKIQKTITPTGKYTNWLKQRYAVYKALYPAVKDQFQKLKEISL